jgi:2-methylcitrate dehydratase PrpD
LLTLNLGKVFTGIYTSQKEYPCCHGQHTAIKATLNLIDENAIKPKDIMQITVHVSPHDHNYLACPEDRKRNPANIIESQFSLYWAIASAIAYRSVSIRNFTQEALHDLTIREIVPKITAIPEVDLVVGQSFTPAIVDIVTKDGKKDTRRVDFPFGSPENPMSFADVSAKLRHCCKYSIKPIPGENQEKVIQMVNEIEKLDDVSKIIRLLA